MKQNDKPDREVQKQMLKDLEHLFVTDLGRILVLKSEGTPEQLEEAKQKMHSNLHKYSDEMQKIAKTLGGNMGELVDQFIKCMFDLLETLNNVDPSKLGEYHKIISMLEQSIKLKFDRLK